MFKWKSTNLKDLEFDNSEDIVDLYHLGRLTEDEAIELFKSILKDWQI